MPLPTLFFLPSLLRPLSFVAFQRSWPPCASHWFLLESGQDCPPFLCALPPRQHTPPSIHPYKEHIIWPLMLTPWTPPPYQNTVKFRHKKLKSCNKDNTQIYFSILFVCLFWLRQIVHYKYALKTQNLGSIWSFYRSLNFQSFLSVELLWANTSLPLFAHPSHCTLMLLL